MTAGRPMGRIKIAARQADVGRTIKRLAVENRFLQNPADFLNSLSRRDKETQELIASELGCSIFYWSPRRIPNCGQKLWSFRRMIRQASCVGKFTRPAWRKPWRNRENEFIFAEGCFGQLTGGAMLPARMDSMILGPKHIKRGEANAISRK